MFNRKLLGKKIKVQIKNNDEDTINYGEIITESPIFDDYFSLDLQDWVESKLDKLPGCHTDYDSPSFVCYDIYYIDAKTNECLKVESALEYLIEL